MPPPSKRQALLQMRNPATGQVSSATRSQADQMVQAGWVFEPNQRVQVAVEMPDGMTRAVEVQSENIGDLQRFFRGSRLSFDTGRYTRALADTLHRDLVRNVAETATLREEALIGAQGATETMTWGLSRRLLSSGDRRALQLQNEASPNARMAGEALGLLAPYGVGALSSGVRAGSRASTLALAAMGPGGAGLAAGKLAGPAAARLLGRSAGAVRALGGVGGAVAADVAEGAVGAMGMHLLDASLENRPLVASEMLADGAIWGGLAGGFSAALRTPQGVRALRRAFGGSPGRQLLTQPLESLVEEASSVVPGRRLEGPVWRGTEDELFDEAETILRNVARGNIDAIPRDGVEGAVFGSGVSRAMSGIDAATHRAMTAPAIRELAHRSLSRSGIGQDAAVIAKVLDDGLEHISGLTRQLSQPTLLDNISSVIGGETRMQASLARDGLERAAVMLDDLMGFIPRKGDDFTPRILAGVQGADRALLKSLFDAASDTLTYANRVLSERRSGGEASVDLLRKILHVDSLASALTKETWVHPEARRAVVDIAESMRGLATDETMWGEKVASLVGDRKKILSALIETENVLYSRLGVPHGERGKRIGPDRVRRLLESAGKDDYRDAHNVLEEIERYTGVLRSVQAMAKKHVAYDPTLAKATDLLLGLTQTKGFKQAIIQSKVLNLAKTALAQENAYAGSMAIMGQSVVPMFRILGGAAMGGAFGGAFMGPAGAVIGAAAGVVSAALSRPVSSLRRWDQMLRQRGSVARRASRSITSVRRAVQTGVLEQRLTAPKALHVGGIGYGLGHAATQEEKLEHFRQARDYLLESSANQDDWIDTISVLSSEAGRVDPDLGVEVASALERGRQHLVNWLPATPVDPYTNRPTDPSMAEVDAFEARFVGVNDPLSLLESLADGSISAEQVAAVGEVYPELYAEMAVIVSDIVADAGDKVPYNVRVMLDTFFGLQDETLTPAFVQSMQQQYAQTEQQNTTISGRQPTTRRPVFADTEQTTPERLRS